MHSRFRVKNPLGRALLRVADLFLPNSVGIEHIQPRRILLCNLAHFGDVVIATSILPVIKDAYPKAKIGFLIGSWSKEVLDDHPLVDEIHVIDHWALNRSGEPWRKKMQRYFKTRAHALQGIKKAAYDVSIDLYSFFPNAAVLCWRAKIPSRIGYISGGCGSLFTHPFLWENRQCHTSLYHLALLEPLGIRYKKPLPPFLPSSQPDGLLREKLAPAKRDYIVFHMGAGAREKQWSLEKWKNLASLFSKEGYVILFTGRGKEELQAIDEIIHSIPNAVNLCDQLNWKEYCAVIARAKLVVCVDSVAGHLAAAWKIPTIVLFSGINQCAEWRPVNPHARIAMNNVPCAPCFQKKGCATMACIQGIEASTLFKQGMGLLYREPLGCVNLKGHHNGPSLHDPSSAILKQYGSRHDRTNLDRSETLQIHKT